MLDWILGGDHHERRGQRAGDPSLVTWRSSIASSSAAWVLGLARLISSPTTTLAKIAPGLNTNSEAWRSQIETPVTSEGSRSGVNWIRLKSQSIDLANDLASKVLPTPGTSSMRTCPSATRQSRICSIGWRLPWMTFSMLVAMRAEAVGEPVDVAGGGSGHSAVLQSNEGRLNGLLAVVAFSGS